SAASVTGGSFRFVWNTVNTYPPVGYQVQYSTNLVDPAWLDVGGVLTGTNGALGFTNSLGIDSQRFYRVVLVQ
ncbi:MAG: repeat containing protein, partial [Pedosphaera sp.]|nr:repeat containing protein [Pedosphaera sp.]